MTGRERKQLKILVVLLAVLGLILFLGPRLNRPPTASVESPAPAVAQASAPAAVDDARIRLDLVEGASEDASAGRENLFQYRNTRPAPEPPRSPVIRPGVNDPFATPAATTPVVPAGPPPPPPPPPITLKYQGFARNPTGGELTAFLVDSLNPNEFAPHYNAKVGDLLSGRYRILGVTESTVDVEDLQYKRRQVLPLLK